MFRGEIGDWLILFGILGLLANFWWSYANWKAHNVNQKNFQLSAEIREQALDDAAAIRTNDFRVCKTCGRIVQGFCGTCAINFPQGAVKVD